MKKIAKLVCIMGLLNTQYSFVKAQNLVPNPSFEDTLGCPEGYPDLDGKCANWMSFRGSPDYLHNCSTIGGFYNFAGHQEPNNGQAYAGFGTYQATNSLSREHIGVQLISPLNIGTKYYVTFYVATAWNGQLTNIATNKIGTLLTTYIYSDPNSTNNLINYSTYVTENIISDTVNWTKISGSFIADSAYQNLIIGNFYDDSNTDTLQLPYQVVSQVAYYYLDDVCLSSDSIFANQWTFINEHDKNMNANIFPNPVSETIFIKSVNEIESILIYDLLGKNKYYFSWSNDLFQTGIDINKLNVGLYIVQINYTNEKTSFYKIIKN